MTTIEFRKELNEKYGLDKEWPRHLEVDNDTYANICQSIFDYNSENEEYRNDLTIKRMTLSFGINNGILYKGIELILDGRASNKHLDLEEVRTLYNLLERQYVSYEDMKGIEIVRKLRNILEDADAEDHYVKK